MIVAAPLSLPAIRSRQAEGRAIHPSTVRGHVVHGVVVADGFTFALSDGDEASHAIVVHHGHPVRRHGAVIATDHILALRLQQKTKKDGQIREQNDPKLATLSIINIIISIIITNITTTNIIIIIIIIIIIMLNYYYYSQL